MKESRVYLRALEPDDYKTSIAWRKDPEIWGMLGGAQYFVSEAYEKKWVEDTIFKGGDIKLAVCLKENDIYIGNVYATNINMINRSAETHVLIGNKDYWGHGYASEAYTLLAKFLFEERGLMRLQALVLQSNIASIKMHEKVGYVQEGILRNSVFKGGRFQNQVVMSLLNPFIIIHHNGKRKKFRSGCYTDIMSV